MEGFKTFTQALDLASASCSSWFGPEDHVVYEWADLMNTAAILDLEYSLPSECYYCVFPDGEIDIANTETKTIEPVFLPIAGAPVGDMERSSFQLDPDIYQRGLVSDSVRNEKIHEIDLKLDEMISEGLDKLLK